MILQSRKFHSRSFLSIQLLNELSYLIHFTYHLSHFLLIIFFILNSIWFVFCNSFSQKNSRNLFTIQVTNNISPWNCVFNFTNKKNLFLPILGITFSKSVFVFWYLYKISNFKFRLGFIRIFVVFSIRIWCNVNWFHFYCSLNCVIIFINNIV